MTRTISINPVLSVSVTTETKITMCREHFAKGEFAETAGTKVDFLLSLHPTNLTTARKIPQASIPVPATIPVETRIIPDQTASLNQSNERAAAGEDDPPFV
jgi:hypothetical protein